jgi:hypothetical protein
MVEKYKKMEDQYPSTKEWFHAMMKEIHSEINSVIDSIRKEINENPPQMNEQNRELLVQF